LGIFSLKSATERFRVSSESFQPNISIEDCIGLRQAPDLDVSGAHVSSFAEVPKQKKQDFGTSRWRLSNKSYTNFSCAEGGLAEGADRQVRLNLVENGPDPDIPH